MSLTEEIRFRREENGGIQTPEGAEDLFLPPCHDDVISIHRTNIVMGMNLWQEEEILEEAKLVEPNPSLLIRWGAKDVDVHPMGSGRHQETIQMTAVTSGIGDEMDTSLPLWFLSLLLLLFPLPFLGSIQDVLDPWFDISI